MGQELMFDRICVRLPFISIYLDARRPFSYSDDATNRYVLFWDFREYLVSVFATPPPSVLDGKLELYPLRSRCVEIDLLSIVTREEAPSVSRALTVPVRMES